MASFCRNVLILLHRLLLPAFVLLMRLEDGLRSLFGRVEQVEFWKHPPPTRARPGRTSAFGSGLHSVGTMLSSMMIVPMKTATVRGLLPRDLELGPQDLAPPGEHPVCFMFCLQKDVRPFLLGRGMKYLEFILAVPYVQWAKDTGAYRGPFIFMPRLFLDHWLPVILGWFYGFAKVRARMAMAENAYSVRSYLLNHPILSGKFVPQGEPGPPASFPLFRPVSAIFRQPFVARTFLGPYLCSVFDFHLDEASMQAINADAHVAEAFLPGLPVGDFHVKGIDVAPLGAFYIQVPWTLSPPLECSCMSTNPLG